MNLLTLYIGVAIIKLMFLDRGSQVIKEGLSISALQHDLIAENIANISTPGYRRKDANFKMTLSGMMNEGIPMQRTHSGHIPFNFNPGQMNSIIRNDNTTSVNSFGNNVDLDKEMVGMATNNTYFNALTSFANKKFRMLDSVISERVV